MEQSLTTARRARAGRPGALTLASRRACGAVTALLVTGLLALVGAAGDSAWATGPVQPSPSAAPAQGGGKVAGRPATSRRVEGGTTRAGARRVLPGDYRTTVVSGKGSWFRFRLAAGERARVRATVRGTLRGRVPPQARGCQAWRVELYNPYGEGGAYPPYGRSGVFAGVGTSRVGVSTSGPVAEFSDGIDYAGDWTVRLALAVDIADSCSEQLSADRAYPARLAVVIERGDDSAGPGPETVTDDPSSSGDLEDESAATKYRTPVSPTSTPVWAYPLGAVAVTLLLGTAVVGVRLVLRRRRQGW